VAPQSSLGARVRARAGRWTCGPSREGDLWPGGRMPARCGGDEDGPMAQAESRRPIVAPPTLAASTATGTPARNVAGSALAITVFSTLKGWSRAWLPILFTSARLVPQLHMTLDRLSFIHFARWTVVDRIPFNGPPQLDVQLHHPHMYFESNFNGGWEEYIDAFAHIIGWGMTAFWGSSYGYPGPVPTAPFKAYIRRNEIEASHFYSAYPEAPTTMVNAALKLAPALDELRAGAPEMTADEFARAWLDFVDEHQRRL
jgi:hypothetical protein